MEYTVIINGRSYDLPKKTLAVMEKVDEVLKVDSMKGYTVKQKFEKLHGFMKNLVGEENAAEMFGSSNLSEIDLSELTLAVQKVIDAYDKPITDYQAEKSKSKLEQLPIEKIVSISKAVDKIAAMEPQKK